MNKKNSRYNAAINFSISRPYLSMIRNICDAEILFSEDVFPVSGKINRKERAKTDAAKKFISDAQYALGFDSAAKGNPDNFLLHQAGLNGGEKEGVDVEHIVPKAVLARHILITLATIGHCPSDKNINEHIDLIRCAIFSPIAIVTKEAHSRLNKNKRYKGEDVDFYEYSENLLLRYDRINNESNEGGHINIIGRDGMRPSSVMLSHYVNAASEPYKGVLDLASADIIDLSERFLV